MREELRARTPVQAGNLLSALRHMIRWIIEEERLDPEDDPTIGLKSGKAKASRESGGWVPWSEEHMAKYRARWPLGTEARLMFDILHYTFLRLGDAHRFGPSHLKRILKQMAIEIETEKSKGSTKVSIPIHPDCQVARRSPRCRHLGDWRGVHRQAGQGRGAADGQEGLGGEIQEVRSPCRDQRAQDELPWRAEGVPRTWPMRAQRSRT
ncbi:MULTISPECIES: hypothetical protein [unclassified Bradyrhizobium]|uniref:hypothetical protein n=1 Tax=unclassified Bradyrhizobium TaxID=2631580 RepID=UPI00247850A1|nr:MULTISPECIES: hypothetical protein [unclassified Bradyrhizobium]WGS23530.1 hypothetical protein MTX22_19060 [Bradyrhizobium sp. ISRA463]WGS30553.1 hypothetical protein MTX19_16785 [Bradyrhizobium sp. ISRA464]